MGAVQYFAEDDRDYGNGDERCPVVLQAQGAGRGNTGGVVEDRQLHDQAGNPDDHDQYIQAFQETPN